MDINEHTLEDLFNIANSMFERAIDDGSVHEEERAKAVETIECAMSKVYSDGLFSKNEGMDETPTTHIKYRYLPYYYATMIQKCVEPSVRLRNLIKAKENLSEFVDTCISLRIVPENDLSLLREDVAVPPDQKRMQKIERYKRQKASKERIQTLKRLLFITKEDSEIDHEEEAREMAITQLAVYATEAIEEMQMIDQEIQMLRHRDMLATEAADAGLTSAPPRPDPPRPGEGPGINVVRFNKVGDQVVSSQETIRANMRADVFRPRMSAPTMSLEEFADLELADARRREERERESVSNGEGEIRKYKQLEGDGDEDNEKLVEQATIKDRDWDDWKDENPRGSGNKMGKRF